MDESFEKNDFLSAEDYHPEAEYTPLELEEETEPPVQAEPAPAVSKSPAFGEVPVQPASGAGYPRPAGYPPYPYYAAPYGQPPVQMPPQPFYPGYPSPVMPYYPQTGAVPPYPVQPPYPYPAQPTPPVLPPQPVQSVQPAAAPSDSGQQPDKKAKKPTTSLGTKIYLIVLTALMAAMVAGFAVYVAHVADQDKAAAKSSDADYEERLKDILDDPESTNDFGFNNIEEFDEEITLVEDKGETQQRDDDNADSVGEPDPKAKGIALAALPKDKDNAKYSAQSTYESVGSSVVTIELYEDTITDDGVIVGSGTGTVISADGYLITNAHVIKNSRIYAVKVVMPSGETYQAKIIGYDTWTDLAVLKIDAEGLTPVVFGDSELIEIGQDVVAIGSPGGEKFQNSLTKGIVSAVGRELSINKYVRYIQSDAAISPGNSGGPLCNIYGQVIGINTAKTTATNYEAMTFSIPSATVQEIVNELLHYGYVRNRPRIGFAGTEVSSDMQYYYGVPAGVIVGTIDPSGALAGTDIRENDIITAVDGQAISSFQDVYAILNQHQAGDKITLSVYRIEE